MKIRRIYIDTSVIGGCHDGEFAPWSKGLMRDFRPGVFKPVLSGIVALEIMDAPELVRRTYAELLSLEPEMLEVTEEALDWPSHTRLETSSPQNFSTTDATLLWQPLPMWTSRSVGTSGILSTSTRYSSSNAINIEQGYKMLHIHSPREVTYNAE
ncbi:hypothetical protein [Rhodocaloribacter sp.]